MLAVLYLVFNEGYTATAGDHLVRRELCDEAIRLEKLLAVLMPDEAEVLGLLALMLFHDSRRRARTSAKARADPARGSGSVALERRAHRRGPPCARARGPAAAGRSYQLQAAIASVHAEETTDWSAIAELYARLTVLTPSPIVELNRAVAVAMARGADEAST